MEELILWILELVAEPIIWIFKDDDGGDALNPGATEPYEHYDD